MNLYTDAGWLNIPEILNEGYPFIFITGGRGTGKTYGALLHARQRSSPMHRFMLLRRTQAQVELISKPEFSPFKAIDIGEGTCTVTQPLTKYTSGFYNGEPQDDGTVKPYGPMLGCTAALSTFSNLRSWATPEIDLCIFDEFVPQKQERPIKHEAEALWHCYESLARNRELSGMNPVQLLCMANANTLGNPIFLDLQLVSVAERMREKEREIWTDDNRGIMLIILQHSPISEAKRNTVLYRLQQNSEFARMSLDNDFAYEERSETGRLPLRELTPLVIVGEICVYRRKSGGYYISGHKSGSPPTFGTGPSDLARFRMKYNWLWRAYMNKRIIFEQYLQEILFTKYFG